MDKLAKTTDFYIYYANPNPNPAASAYANNATYGRNAVWANYRLVSHDGGITDSTGNFTPTNTGTTATSSGKFGEARIFNGTSNYITLGTDTNILGSNPRMISHSYILYKIKRLIILFFPPSFAISSSMNRRFSLYLFSQGGASVEFSLGRAYSFCFSH